PGELSERMRIDYGNGLVHDGSNSEIRGLMRRHSQRRMGTDPRLAFAARSCLPAIWLEDMDVEGIDVAVLLPTPTMSITLIDGLDPRHAMAMCRAYNDWVAEFAAESPERLKFW